MTAKWAPWLLLLLPFGSVLLALWRFIVLVRRPPAEEMPLLPPVPRPGFGKLTPKEADAMRNESEMRRKRADKLRRDSARTSTKDDERSVIRIVGRPR